MSVETLRADVSGRLRELAWSQWSQLGVSAAPPSQRAQAAADPEALLLFTLEIGRDDPRLFDEALDWLLLHEPWISTHRLRGLCAGPADTALVAAALDWSAAWGPRGKTTVRTISATGDARGQALFRGMAEPVRGQPLDAAFEGRGFSRPPLTPSRKSQPADLGSPIAFALRLRRIFGVGARAEVVRALLTIGAPRLQGQVIAASAGFTARNVREALATLVEAMVVDMVVVSDERLYLPNLGRWAPLFGVNIDELPRHVDWIQLFRAMVKLLRWLDEAAAQDWSAYIRASHARVLIDELQPDLRYAGIRVDGGQQVLGAAYWEVFERQVAGILAQLPVGAP